MSLFLTASDADQCYDTFEMLDEERPRWIPSIPQGYVDLKVSR